MYARIICIGFGLIYLPKLLGIIAEFPIGLYFPFDKWKWIVLLFVLLFETLFIKNWVAKFLGLLASVGLLIGFMFKIMRWPNGTVILLISGAVLLVLWLLMALVERNKALFHYLIFGFVTLPLLSAGSWFSKEIAWYTEMVMGNLVAISAGLNWFWYCRRKPKIKD